MCKIKFYWFSTRKVNMTFSKTVVQLSACFGLAGGAPRQKEEDFQPYLQSCGCRRRRTWASWRCAPWNSGPPNLPAAGCGTASVKWEGAHRGWPEERGEWGGWRCAAEPSQCCRGGWCCRSRPTAAPSCCRCCFGRSCPRSCCGCSWSWRTGSAWASAAETRKKGLRKNWVWGKRKTGGENLEVEWNVLNYTGYHFNNTIP